MVVRLSLLLTLILTFVFLHVVEKFLPTPCLLDSLCLSKFFIFKTWLLNHLAFDTHLLLATIIKASLVLSWAHCIVVKSSLHVPSIVEGTAE